MNNDFYLALNHPILSAYIECALWSSCDDNSAPLDDNYFQSDIEETALESMRKDCEDFYNSNSELLQGLTNEQIGVNFWLTRNRHGAGFWDLGLNDRGKLLTDAAHAYGSSDLYLGDDGKLYVS